MKGGPVIFVRLYFYLFVYFILGLFDPLLIYVIYNIPKSLHNVYSSPNIIRIV
jgi:hypothetical protein